MFSFYGVPHDSKETKFGRRFSISQYKNRGRFSVQSRIKMCPSSYFRWYKFVKLVEFSVKVTKVTFTVSVLNTHILSLLFYLTVFQLKEKAILLKVCKLDNFGLYNTLQVINIRILVGLLIFLVANLSLNQILLILLLNRRQTGKTQLFLVISL